MPDRELLIEAEWKSYLAEVVPKDAGEDQITETRRAFYAGAGSLFKTILNILEPGTEATDVDLQTMSLIDAELERFLGKVKAGHA